MRPVRVAAVFVVLFLPLTYSHCGDSVTLLLKWDHEFQFAGYYAAEWQGYYREADLDVTIETRVKPDGSLRDVGTEIRDGNVDFAIAGPDLLLYRDQGIPVVILATILQDSPLAFVAVAGRYRSPAEFRGGRVNITEKQWGPVELHAMMKASGGDPSTVHNSDFTPDLSLLLEDKCDVVATYLPSATWQMRELGTSFDIFTAREYGVHFYGDTLVTHQRVIDADPDVVERFTKASLRGWKFALEHSDEMCLRIARDLTRTYDFFDDIEAYNRHEAADIAALTYFPTVTLGHSSRDRWQKTWQYFRGAGHVTGTLDIDTLIYDPDLERRRRASTLTRLLFVLVGTTSLALFVLWLWSRTLRSRVAQKTRELTELNMTLEKRVAQRTADLEIATAKAQLAAQSKSEFLATMSHEIRTPMNGILGASELLLEAPIGKEERDFVGIIRTCSESLLTVLNDILDFSKIEAGKMTLESVPMDIKDVVDDVYKFLDLSAREKNLTLTVEYPAFYPRLVMGDPSRLRQVLLNLVGNAIKFTDAGTVQISLSARPITGTRYECAFAIADTGVGIPEDKFASIFSCFTQADPSTSRRFGGTGLGLSISRNLTAMMGGTLTLASEDGVGSKFTLTVAFDLAPGEQSAGVEAKPAAVERNYQKKILLVEDNRFNQIIASKSLESVGMECEIAINGIEAMEFVQKYDYDLVLMDIRMPEMDGIEATRRIRALAHSMKSRIPIIAFTADVLDQSRDVCFEAGMNGLLTKPLTLENMVRELDNWFATDVDGAGPHTVTS